MSTTLNSFIAAADSSGNIQLINIGKSDNSSPIYYELETQELEFGDRAHLKKIQDKLVVLSKYAVDSTVQIKQDEKDYKPVPVSLDNTVSVSGVSKYSFHYLALKWLGNSSNLSPIFDGFFIKELVDLGILP